MLIKNSLRLLLNNLSVIFKAMLYSLVVVFLTYLLVTVVFSDIFKTISQSPEFTTLMDDLNKLWHGFISGNLSKDINLVDSFEQFMEAIRIHANDYCWSIVGLAVGVYIITLLNNICAYTLTDIMNARMSTYEKKGFFVSLIANLKKSLPFEALYSLLSIFGAVLSISVGALFIVYAFTHLYLLSIVIGTWLAILFYSVYLTLTSTLRPSFVTGSTLKETFTIKYSRTDFGPILASFVVALIVSVSINVMMFISTLGAGMVLAIPLTQLLFVLIQLVLHYSLKGQKYYVDYETIETPNKIKQDSQNADFLDDIEV